MKNLKNYLNDISNKTLMVIYPHPDDETMAAGGLLLFAKKLGWKTIVVTLTHGEAGQIHIKGNGKSLGEIRKNELEDAVAILGVHKLILGDFPDGKLKETKEKWSKWMQDQINIEKPGLIVTYDQTGVTGHPDHISLSLELKRMITDSGQAGMTTHRLVWNTVDYRSPYRKFIHKDVVGLLPEVTWTIDLGIDWVKKWKAAVAHKSQHLGKSMPIPLWLVFFIFHKEWYHEVDLTKDYPYKYVEFKI